MSARFTAEERNLDKQDTLNMLRNGISQREISIERGRSEQYKGSGEKFYKKIAC